MKNILNSGRLSNNTEGNQGKEESWWIDQPPNLFTIKKLYGTAKFCRNKT